MVILLMVGALFSNTRIADFHKFYKKEIENSSCKANMILAIYIA